MLEAVREWGFKNEETRKHLEQKLARDKKRKQGQKKLTAAEKYALIMRARHPGAD